MPKLVTSNRAFLAAYEKGRHAGLEAKDANLAARLCPYRDWRGNYHESVTFSRAFRKYWADGFFEGVAKARGGI